MTFICFFLLPHRSATSGADFIFATANIRISDGIFLFLIILFCQINSSFISKRISYELWRIYIKFHFVLLQHLKSRVHVSEEQTFTKILNKSQMQRISLTWPQHQQSNKMGNIGREKLILRWGKIYALDHHHKRSKKTLYLRYLTFHKHFQFRRFLQHKISVQYSENSKMIKYIFLI